MMSNKYFLLQKNDLYNLLVSNAKAFNDAVSFYKFCTEQPFLQTTMDWKINYCNIIIRIYTPVFKVSIIYVNALQPNQATLRLRWEQFSQNFSPRQKLCAKRILRLGTSSGDTDI